MKKVKPVIKIHDLKNDTIRDWEKLSPEEKEKIGKKLHIQSMTSLGGMLLYGQEAETIKKQKIDSRHYSD